MNDRSRQHFPQTAMEPLELSAKRADPDDWSKHWASYADTASENPAQGMRHKLILSLIRRMPEKIDLLLDVGSGQGDFLRRAAGCQIARQLVGLELSKVGVAVSQAKVPEATFIEANLFDPPQALREYAGRADVAVCSEVIEHVDHPIRFLQSLRGYLKPGGQLIVTVPRGPMSAFDHHIGHRRHFDAHSIVTVLRSAGFFVEKVQLAGFPFFNLYRLTVLVRGRKLIDDVTTGPSQGHPNRLAILAMRAFRLLFRWNADDSPFGWQVVAIARKLVP
jgi:2-polyprenyl-3-methyl-5-hydroxy-6-metoxy-1,4-benzoquinol methylase